MNNEELKEYMRLLIEANTGQIKEHINEVNDKARQDFNKKFEKQQEEINGVKDIATSALSQINFGRKLIYGIAGVVGFIGLERLSAAIKVWGENV